MKKTLLTAVSTLALMAAAPAFADPATSAEQRTQTPAPAEYSTQDVKEGYENAKEAVAETAEDISDATKNSYRDMKAAFTGQKDFSKTNVDIDKRTTASSMIGQAVYNPSGEAVAKIKDIIVDKDGHADMVILGDGDITGWGKTVAYDYDMVTNKTSEGDIITPLTEDLIAKAQNFSYDQNEANETTIAIPVSSYSVAKLLDSQITNPTGETLAQVDDVAFKDGAISHLIIGFDKTLGMGGENAALAYDDVTLMKINEEVDFQLSADKATQLENFMKTATN